MMLALVLGMERILRSLVWVLLTAAFVRLAVFAMAGVSGGAAVDDAAGGSGDHRLASGPAVIIHVLEA